MWIVSLYNRVFVITVITYVKRKTFDKLNLTEFEERPVHKLAAPKPEEVQTLQHSHMVEDLWTEKEK